MKRFFNLILLVLMVAFVGSLTAQTTVSGIATDADGETLIGASIYAQGAPGVGTTTDIDGKYTLTLKQNPPFTLVCSYTGFADATQNVTASGTVNFELSSAALGLDEIVVTGVVNPKSRLETALTVSTIGTATIEQSAPRTAAEVFRNIPGIRAENSGGDGNANLSARGVPVSSGGSRYFQIQEDGLPLIMFGDISFGNSDNWLRLDNTVGRIESIRGGSASTGASNSPAGIINLISKTGAVEGGSIATNIGLDYGSYRTDFEYGAPIGNGLSFHVGGFMRTGQSQRTVGYLGNKGGQIKANMTKQFGDKGYVRLFVKHLNDRSAMYLPTPAIVKGDIGDPTWESVDGFDLGSGAQHSKFLTNSVGLNSLNNNRRNSDVRDGNHPKSSSVGMNFSFDLGNDWTFTGKGRLARNNGTWLGPFTEGFRTPAETIAAVNGATSTDLANATLMYADDGSPLDLSNGLIQNIHMFDVTLDNMDNFISDVKVSKKIGEVAVTAGYFRAIQNTGSSWNWNAFLSEVKGDGTARLIDVNMVDSLSGVATKYSRNGQWAYGTPAWGNCCQRNYDMVHVFSSPYFGVDAKLTDAINFDASVRVEQIGINGTIRGGGDGTLNVGGYDMDGNGKIEGLENDTPVLGLHDKRTVDDNFSYVTYSGGLNYKLNNKSALFGRYSWGASARAADRTGYNDDGSATTEKDGVLQAEIGYKQKIKGGFINATAFMSETKEDAGQALNLTVGNEFRSIGVEVEGSYKVNKNFSILGSATFVDAEITKDNASGTEANSGNKPQRQAALLYNLSPRYVFGNNTNQHVIGLSILGTSSSYAGDDNTLVQPGYAYLNLLATAGLSKGLSAGVSINNLLDTVGITEVNNPNAGPAIGGDGIHATARSIAGRTTNLIITYRF